MSTPTECGTVALSSGIAKSYYAVVEYEDGRLCFHHVFASDAPQIDTFLHLFY